MSGVVEFYREEAKGAKVLKGFIGVLRDFAVQIPTLSGRDCDFANTLRDDITKLYSANR